MLFYPIRCNRKEKESDPRSLPQLHPVTPMPKNRLPKENQLRLLGNRSRSLIDCLPELSHGIAKYADGRPLSLVLPVNPVF